MLVDNCLRCVARQDQEEEEQEVQRRLAEQASVAPREQTQREMLISSELSGIKQVWIAFDLVPWYL